LSRRDNHHPAATAKMAILIVAAFPSRLSRYSPGSGNGAAQPAVDVKSLHAKIGELTLENDFLEGALTKAGLLSAKR